MKGKHRKGLKLEDIPIDVQNIIKDLVYDTDECIQTIYPQLNRVGDEYGVLQRYDPKKGKRVRFRTHRVSQVLFNREIREGEVVCHTCDNPQCINPKHLWAGTDLENQQDKVKKSRQAKGEKNGRYIDGFNTKKSIAERFAKKGAKIAVIEEANKYMKSNPLESNRSIARRYGICHSTVNKLRKKYEELKAQ